MNGQTEGLWMAGWTGRLIGGWVNYGWICEWMNGWMDGCVNGWMDGCVNGWMDECVNGWMGGWMGFQEPRESIQ